MVDETQFRKADGRQCNDLNTLCVARRPLGTHRVAAKQIRSPKPRGRKHAPARPILDRLIYHFRTGCQWNQIPKVYGDDSTIHRAFQRLVRIGLFEMIWSLLQAECDELELVARQWQAADGSMGKAYNGGDQIGPNPTDRAKPGSKKPAGRRADGQQAIVVAPANANDHLLL